VDFKQVLEKLLTAFREQDIRYALMGGFAIGLWGGSRSTVDLDFLVHRDDIQRIHSIVTALSYEIHHKTENVSQYTSSLKVFGGIDFIHAFRDASIEMLKRAVDKDILGGAIKIRTLIPEDIVGLKLQAIYNNPSRENIDMADIETLVSVNKENLNWELIQQYCSIFGMDDRYRKLREGLK